MNLPWRQILWSAVLLIGCGRTLHPESPARMPDSVLELSRARPIPNPLQARYHFKVKSTPLNLAGNTSGALIVDRPGRGHLAVLGPLGTPLATLSADGTGVAVDFFRDARHMVAVDAESVIRENTGGIAGIDDLFGLLVGDLPLDEAKVKSRATLENGQVQLVLLGPRKSLMTAVLDVNTGAPASLLAEGPHGRRLLSAEYGAFQLHDDGTLLPSTVAVEIPQLELTLDLKYKWWKTLDEVPPVFDLAAPEGFRTESLEYAVQSALHLQPPAP